MKVFLLLSIFFFSGNILAKMTATEKQLIEKAIGSSSLSFNTPSGNFKAAVLKRFSSVVLLVADVGNLTKGQFDIKKTKIFLKKKRGFSLGRSKLNPEFMMLSDGYAMIGVTDVKGKLGVSPVPNLYAETIKSTTSFVRFMKFSGKQSGLVNSGYDLSGLKNVTLLAFGEVKIGMFAGKVTAVGNSRKKKLQKHALSANVAVGALIGKVGNHEFIFQDMPSTSQEFGSTVAVASLKSPKGQLHFMINDKKTRDNKGDFGVLILGDK